MAIHIEIIYCGIEIGDCHLHGATFRATITAYIVQLIL